MPAQRQKPNETRHETRGRREQAPQGYPEPELRQRHEQAQQRRGEGEGERLKLLRTPRSCSVEHKIDSKRRDRLGPKWVRLVLTAESPYVEVLGGVDGEGEVEQLGTYRRQESQEQRVLVVLASEPTRARAPPIPCQTRPMSTFYSV